MSEAPLIEARGLDTYYGASHVLRGVDFRVGRGETVSLLGRNGMGKTTTVRCLSGLLRPTSGEIWFKGARIDRAAPHAIAHAGLGLVPEGRHIFPNLTVRENLVMAAIRRPGRADPWSFERVLDFFPRLAERLTNGGNQLSGGEQQMLAIGRALMTQPRLLMLDEPSQGIMPKLVDDIFIAIQRIRDLGLTVLLVEQRLAEALEIADYAYVLQTGRVVMSGKASDIAGDAAVRKAYLGL